MRFLKGLAGAWLGLTIATLAISAYNGSLASVNWNLAVNNLIFAAVATTIVSVVERPNWTWGTYAWAGVYTTGLLLFVGFCVIAGALAQEGTTLGWAAYAITAVTSSIAGALSGVGFRTLTGVKG